jgi:GNAT superfamily N-acetyltransferase
VKLRRAGAGDLSAVNELTRRAYGHYRASFGDDPTPMKEDYALRIADGQVWLLEDAAIPVGLIVLEDKPDRLFIYSVVVSPDRQSGGLGRRLLTFAEDVAADRGHAIVGLSTNALMKRNIRIYGQWGFVEVDRRPFAPRPGWTLVTMEKRVATRRKQEAV